MYTRPSSSRKVSIDAVPAWKRTLDRKSLDAFHDLRQIIWRRIPTAAASIAKTIAASNKQDLKLFETHFEWMGHSYELEEPKVLKQAKRSDRGKASFVHGVLSSMIADGQMDRVAVLVLGLSLASKIPIWTEFEDAQDVMSAWSETDGEDE